MSMVRKFRCPEANDHRESKDGTDGTIRSVGKSWLFRRMITSQIENYIAGRRESPNVNLPNKSETPTNLWHC